MRINKLYQIELDDLCAEMNLEPQDFSFYDPDGINTMVLSCDHENYQNILQSYKDALDCPLFANEELKAVDNTIKAIKHLRNNYGIYNDVIVGGY